MPKQIATGEPHKGAGLKNSLHGIVYQLILLMWLIDRCVNDNDIEGFSLSTEDDRGEKFDDAVI